jgi:hypothetical protein
VAHYHSAFHLSAHRTAAVPQWDYGRRAGVSTAPEGHLGNSVRSSRMFEERLQTGV